MNEKRVLDPCCGSKMFWFDKNNADVEFCDIRTVEREKIWESKDGKREVFITVAPDAQQWIPCSERLPKNEEYVWAVYKNSLFPNGKSHHKTLKYDGEMWIDENGYRYLPANVTHWKHRDPLP